MTIDLKALSVSLSSVQRSIFTFRSERDMTDLLGHFLGTKQEAGKQHLETRKLFSTRKIPVEILFSHRHLHLF